MKATTVLRLVGGAALLWMLYLVGTFNLTSPLVAVFIFGSAAAFEFGIVRPVGKRDSPEVGYEVPSVPAPSMVPTHGTASVPWTVPIEDPQALVVSDASASAITDDAQWAAALAELEENRRHAGTWARAFAAADGDEAKAKATYLRERVQQMQQNVASARQSALSEQEATDMAAANRVAEAKKRFIEGKRITRDEIVTLVNASGKTPLLTSITDRIRGNTLLHLCARYGLHEEALTLLRHGSSPVVGNGNGERPSDLAPSETPLKVALVAARTSVEPQT